MIQFKLDSCFLSSLKLQLQFAGQKLNPFIPLPCQPNVYQNQALNIINISNVRPTSMLRLNNIILS